MRAAAERCPVCQARFRESVTCSRCGADLRALMTLAAQSYQWRQKARRAAMEGDAEGTRAAAKEAQSRHDTSAGRELRLLGEWLVASSVP